MSVMFYPEVVRNPHFHELVRGFAEVLVGGDGV